MSSTPIPTITRLPPLRPASSTNPPAHHIGNPPKSFKNPWPSFSPTGLSSLLRTRFSPDRNFVPVPEDPSQLVQSRAPDWGANNKAGLKATWIGHASFLIETPSAEGRERGVRILLDPVWSARVGPYGMVGPVRFIAPPCGIEEVPVVDAVCISHDHYDHLDSESVRRIRERGEGRVRFFCGLKVKAVLLGLGVGLKEEEVVELDWWDGVRVDVEGVGSAKLICTPAQHRSGRTPWGFDGTLWCSWVVEEVLGGSTSNEEMTEKPDVGKKLFFAGDTGYCHVSNDDEVSHISAPYPPCPAFAEIGELYGPFDLALLPIGCFRPRGFMSGQHSSPDDAVAIHKDIKSKKSIGMHYGTLRGNLSAHYEPVTEPPERWKMACEEQGVKWGEEADLCDIGETVIV